MHITQVGPRAALVEVADAAEALSLAGWVRGRVAAEEVVPAARTVLLDGLGPGTDLAALLAGWSPEVPAPPGPWVTVPVVYDGPDLEAVAAHWGCSAGDVVVRHTAHVFVSAFCGFSPGFAYLSGLPTELAVPRLASPRTRVEAGSVALADAWCGIYPTASPGGWQVIGRTDLTLWDPTREQPALLAPGTRVRFVEAS
ncbi:5-oxoprolinase subunit B family protein [Nocardioides gansuensis]|uniref:5-oxoprolinase subunit B family protein n=1 Tax=Nocardioides gansuensis TaxID=2138300 RepID=UPI001FE32B3F|nr:allophanate hydrolase subunit 1 [Nocardioides gansuensis]